MQSIIESDFQRLQSHEIACRIDRFFYEDELARYGSDTSMLTTISAEAMLCTRALQELPESTRRNALLLFYRARFQLALCRQYGGIENSLIHALTLGDVKWSSPKIQVLNAAMRQATIVAARVSFECLMEFIYIVEKGSLLPSKKSKFGGFRKWCCEHGNRFGWLLFYLVGMQRFDREHRTPEVHGTSYVAVDALRCEVWPREDSELDAVNMMANIWPSVRQTLDGQDVEGFTSTSQKDGVVFEEFSRWREIELREWWEKHSRDTAGATNASASSN